MNCIECKGTGLVKVVCDDPLGQQTFNVHCFACTGTGLGTTVHCIICDKEVPRQHPGQFMCGNPECRREIVKIVEAAKLKERAEVMEKNTLSPEELDGLDMSKLETIFMETGMDDDNKPEIVGQRKPGDLVFMVRQVQNSITEMEKYFVQLKLRLITSYGFDGRPQWNCWRVDGKVQYFDVPENEMYDTKEAAEAAMNAGTVLT